MFYPLSVYIGLRYVRTRRQGFFVSFISWSSMLGVCVGVAALITVLSVMNGFEAELRGRLLSLASHATLSGPAERFTDWQAMSREALKTPGVVGVAPYVESQAMVGHGLDLSGATLRGVLPALEPQVSDIGRYLTSGSMHDLAPGSQHIVLGSMLASIIQARVGDELTVLIPQFKGGVDAPLQFQPRMRTFTITGIFQADVQEHDSALALVSLQDASDLLGANGLPTGLRLKFADIFSAPVLAPQVAARIGGGFTVSDWSQEHASYFRAVRIEKTMMSLILLLVVAVAVFNIVAALVMVVNEKRTDIAILRTVGLTPRSVVAVFMTQGILIGWFGTLLGVTLGLALAFNVETIVPALEQALGVRIMDPAVYVISKIPSEVHWDQVIAIASIALVLTVMSTIYPALRGARTAPADALRYE